MKEYFLEELGVEWYLDFNGQLDNVPEGWNKLPYIPPAFNDDTWEGAEGIESLSDVQLAAKGFHSRVQLAQMAQANPGTLWYIAGEPNRHGFITPTKFASVYHYYYTTIKNADPTATIMGPAILNWNFTCLGCIGIQSGQSWLEGVIDPGTNKREGGFIEKYREKYGTYPPVDVWPIDIYPIDWYNTPNSDFHVDIAVEQISEFRQYLNTFPEYVDTPIWIPEIGIHWGYDNWDYDQNYNLIPIGNYHWEKMGDYLNGVLDWLMANSEAQKIEKWFFLAAWQDIVNPDESAGITMFNILSTDSYLTCLGQIYRNRAMDIQPSGKCHPSGQWISGE